ncbi:MAG: efflux RND transporter permease subunit [Candidatus Kryptoniota bacterium]
MSLTTLSVSRPVTTTMFFFGVALLGTIAFTQMSVNFLPSIQIPELLVQTDYPEAPAEQVEKVVTKPIESIVSTVSGVKKVTSISRNGSSLITLSFSWGTDINYAMLEVREKLDEIKSTLPKEVGRSTIYKIDPSTESIMTISLQYSNTDQNSTLPLSTSNQSGSSDPEFSPRQIAVETSLSNLRELAESLIKRRFEQLNGVSQAVVAGGTERGVYVEIDPSKLQALGLTFDRISEALKNSNLNIEGGTILKGVFRYPIRTVGEFRGLQDIRDVNVSNGHAVFRLGDFANVFEGFAEREGLTRVNGKEAILIYIKKDAGANTIEVSKEVNSAVAELNREYPSIKLTTLIDQAKFISKSITDIEQAILFGALLALLVLFLFLRNPRYPLIVGVVTPFSILMTVILMYFFRINFNIISLTGLALGIGMIGDNAIIIVENFSRLREQGYTVINAVIEGSKEINLSVAASTFTNVAVFLPVVFVKGIAQKLFLDMGITMTLSLLASLLVAITLVPSMLTRIKHSAVEKEQNTDLTRGAKSRLASAVLLVYEKMKSFYLKLLGYSLDNSMKVLLLTFLLTVVAGGIVFLIPSEEAPDIDQSRFVVQISLPPSVTFDLTNMVSAKVESLLTASPYIKYVVADVGISSREDYFKALTAKSNLSVIECTTQDDIPVSEVVKGVHSALKNLNTFLSLYSADITITRPATTFERILQSRENDLDIKVAGNDLNVSYRIAGELLSRLKKIHYLTDVGIANDLTATSPQIWLTLDGNKIKSYNLTTEQVVSTISNLIQKRAVTYFNQTDRKVAVRIIADDNGEPFDLNSVMDANVASSVENQTLWIPVRDLVSVEQTSGYSSILHDNQQRVVSIHANVAAAGIFKAASEIQNIASRMNLPMGYHIIVGGKIDDIRDMFRGLLIIILLSIFVVYVILASEYESIIYPLVILTTSPFSVVGSLITMYLFHQSYNLMSIIGLIIMFGAMDNDAVIAVDMITHNRRYGMSVKEAIIDGMRKRFRPIVMTTLTSILGMLPLIFGFGKGLELAAAISYPIIGGLIGSTIFTLFLIPVVYRYFDIISRTGQAKNI